MPSRRANIRQRPLAKLAGDAYLLGDVSLFLLGGVGGRWNDLVAGAGSILCALILSKAGDRPIWFALSCALGIPLTMLASLPELRTDALVPWCGAILFSAGLGIGALTEPLSHRYAAHPQPLIRGILGQPRRMMGVLIVVGKAPIAWTAFIRADWITGIVLSLWIVGDLLLGLSKPESAINQSALSQP